MGIKKRMLQKKITEKVTFISFNKLDKYFRNPELKVQNLSAISAQQFTKDLDIVMACSKKKSGLYGKIDTVSINADLKPPKKEKRDNSTNPLAALGKLKLFSIFSKSPVTDEQLAETVNITSWSFSNFDRAEKFQVGNIYTLRPVRVTYNSTQQDYDYNKQIISEFCIEKANGTSKELKIIDNIKKDIITREKYIDGEKIWNQNYDLEIRNHHLNRGLMKNFLFRQIKKFKISGYNRCIGLNGNSSDLKFPLIRSKVNLSGAKRKSVLSPSNATQKIPEEYVKIKVLKDPVSKQEKIVDFNHMYHATNKNDECTLVDDSKQIQTLFKVVDNSIYAADGYNEFTKEFYRANALI